MIRTPDGSRPRELFFVFLLYLLLSLTMTWPLVTGMTRDVPGDLGDSLLNMWILGWGAENLPRVVRGELGLAGFANANIFHPEPLALAFSEHLFGQVLQILPVYHLTHNLILSYNLLFISTFVLSGVGMYVLVRDITDDRYAAFFAGVVFAFVPFRVAQVTHIQSLSAQWMPLALYGFRRYLTTSRTLPLAGGALALLMQNWSCGYYLVFFAPFVVVFVLHQIAVNNRWRDMRVWLAFALAAAVVAAGTLPFLSLYLEAQRVHGFDRPRAEIVGFSADVYSYFTAPAALRVTGPWLQAWPKPEGELFLGFVPALTAAIAVVATIAKARRETHGRDLVRGHRAGARAIAAALTLLLLSVAGLMIIALTALLLTGGFVTSVAGIPFRATNAERLFIQLAIAAVAAMLLSPRFRATVAAFLGSATGLAFVSLVLALWLSLGPVAHSRGQTIPGLGVYAVLLDNVPGFGGLRVPARYAMVAAVYLAILAGIGCAWMVRRRNDGRRSALVITAALSLAFLVEGAFAPLPVNQTWSDAGVMPPARIEPAATAPAVYQRLAAIPGDAVVAEFPFGDPAWELRYVYYSTVHWKRLLNGYSGGFPQAYKVRVARLQRVASAPDEAWSALRDAGTTHVVVHEAALPAGEPAALRAWLDSRGAREIGRFGSDVLYDLTHAS